MKNKSNYRHLVDIQRATESQDAVTGELTKVWSNIYSRIPCSIEPLSARDFIESHAHQSEIKVRIEIRYLPDLDEEVRLVALSSPYTDFIYNPVAALPDKHTGLEHITFPCSENVNSG